MFAEPTGLPARPGVNGVALPRAWNAVPGDAERRYGCDAIGFAHDDVFYRAIAIAAPPALVFRWLCQLRVAPYSYDVLDNFARRSPPRLTPGLETLARGQRMMTIFELAGFERPWQLTCRLRSRIGAALMGDFAGTYAIVPQPAGGVRLIAKILVRYPRGAYGAVLRAAMPWMDLVMFRKQLFTLRRYAERDAERLRRATAGTPPLG